MSDMLGTAQVAALLDVGASTVARWCRQGRFPNAKHVGQTWVIPASDLQNFERPRPGPEPRRKD